MTGATNIYNNMSNNKTIGVFFGSRSPEHDISIITAQLVISGLKGLGFKVVPIYITKQGEWLIDESLGSLAAFTQNEKIAAMDNYRRFSLDLEKSHGQLILRHKGLAGKNIIIDIAFPALHGSFGEDGTIQGLFEMFNLPYIGCNVASSAIAMDKALTKQVCQSVGLPITPFVCFTQKEWSEDKSSFKEKIQQLNWPVIVKPVHLGSSIGISQAANLQELENRIEVALYYDQKVLVEEVVENLMDVTCCLIGNEKPRASLLQESVFKADLFNFEEKYLKEGGRQLGKSQSGVVIPARLEPSLTQNIQRAAQKTYRTLGCSGIGRVDFLLNAKTQRFFVNEVNPLPGTLYHHLWKASGLELPELLRELIDLAADRHQQQQNLNYTFESSVLNNIGSQKLNFKKPAT